jgi:hypothetical protein
VTGQHYTVASKLPPLAGSDISEQQITATDMAVPADLARDTELPKTPDIAEISKLAASITEGATNPYDRAKLLRDWFRDPANGFVYDTDVEDTDTTSAILSFLDPGNRHGFCVQFASAYAVMARSLGIPARVAVGFTPGTLTDGVYHVTSHDAHAWPEIHLAGMGWVHLFDPTPSSHDVPVGGSALPNDSPSSGVTTPTQPPPTAVTVPPTGSANPPSGTGTPSGAGTTTPVTPTVAPTSSSSSSGTGPWLAVLLVVLAVVLVVGAYVGAVLGLKRRRRHRRHDAADPAVAVTGAWAEALDRLHEASVVPGATQTPLDLAATVPFTTGAATTKPMHELARAYGAARYGEGAVAADDARDAWESLDALERALDDGVSWSRRWRRRLDASTLARR